MKTVITFIVIFFSSCYVFGQDTSAKIKDKPFVLGRITEIKSTILNENRVLNIYLPVGYNEKDTVKYPVIYLLDGSADEDFIHIAGLVQFANFPWVNLLPPTIVVGIANVDRRRDFTFPTTIEKDKKDFPTTGKSANFISFVETELQPYINKKYKTNATKTIIGESLGGLVATEILFKKPSLFTNYIIVSPSLWWNKESLLTLPPKVLANTFNEPVSIFIAVGKEEKIMEDDTKQLVTILEKANKKNLQVKFVYLPEEDHGTILHNAVYDAFKAFNKTQPKK